MEAKTRGNEARIHRRVNEKPQYSTKNGNQNVDNHYSKKLTKGTHEEGEQLVVHGTE